MNTYIFKTTTTMKPYNNKKWWITDDLISEICIQANNVKEAIEMYRNTVEEKFYVSISDNAIKTKQPMYVDTTEGNTKQVGYVITGKTSFDDSYGRWVDQYIDIWVKIITVVDTEF